ncbi:hypothetical protein PISMIDRAFT_678247, partial [Pisolithus microcarpus 441]
MRGATNALPSIVRREEEGNIQGARAYTIPTQHSTEIALWQKYGDPTKGNCTPASVEPLKFQRLLTSKRSILQGASTPGASPGVL